ncbi:peptidyl-tRNA hydrolase Pth2 [Metallosphaera hakonensis]|uniref:Peptidyl-tRNA hydrolase n=1 Tax=Metallosphaera hakonensis JCM 8857 = DSM 7519 TaxID=1293036 RepID=A0A2U9ITD3_9CREN|nr:peptidyl-tRNA hydrolase Pth2 [Metallosphaera hakonensis]AWR99294.1 peptidyl-tRNA hydrolase [Metallosphaera hakonensis JCM 8857 = DSM 7519]
MKMIIIVRTDIEMGKGKIAAQVAHAAVSLVLASMGRSTWNQWLEAWLEEGQPKVVLKISSLSELLERIERAKSQGLQTTIITDAGRTQVEPGTITCAGIGPAPDNEIDKITSDLKLL